MSHLRILALLTVSPWVNAYDYSTQNSGRFGAESYHSQYQKAIGGQQYVANQRQADQLYKRAVALDSNNGGFESNRTQAVQLWEDAAKLGDIPSRYEAGYAYYVGDGAEVDVQKANEYLAIAAQKEHHDALGLYLVSQMYDSKYRVLKPNQLIGYAEKSVQVHRNVYGMLAYLKMYQDGILKSSSPNREQEIKKVIRSRLSSPNASRIEKAHIPKVISVLKINL